MKAYQPVAMLECGGLAAGIASWASWARLFWSYRSPEKLQLWVMGGLYSATFWV